MILDTSAVIAILAGEPVAAELAALIQEAGNVRISAGTLIEASLVCGPVRQQALDDFIAEAQAEVVPVDEEQARLARDGHLRFGRGSGSPARLNYGDCFSYALARQADDALLFIGDDFTHTDVRSARGEPAGGH